MSKVYKQINFIAGANGASFGGGGGGGSSTERRKRAQHQRDKLAAARRAERDSIPPGQKLFSQFNTDVPGNHSERNTGKMQADAFNQGLANSSKQDKVTAITGAISHTNPIGVSFTAAQIAAGALDQK